jgi:hypothetical protein
MVSVQDIGGNTLPGFGSDGSYVVASLAPPYDKSTSRNPAASAVLLGGSGGVVGDDGVGGIGIGQVLGPRSPSGRLASFDPAEVVLRGTVEVPVVDGVATFHDLHVHEASEAPYRLVFRFVESQEAAARLTRSWSDPLVVEAKDGSGSKPFGSVVSKPFGVGIGPPAKLRLLQSPDMGATVYGGSAFEFPPAVEVVDAGGNRLVGDSEMAVECTFANNPSDATLSPSEYTLQRLVSGVALFTQLRIDRKGELYALRFSLFGFDPVTRDYKRFQPTTTSSGSDSSTSTSSTSSSRSSSRSSSSSSSSSATLGGISVDTKPFTVALGPPYALALTRAPRGAVAGGNAFKVQPAVALVDVGGNVVTTDSQSVVVAGVVASLSVGRLVRVDTRDSPTVKVTRVRCGDGAQHAVVTSGDQVQVLLDFDQEVCWLVVVQKV